MNRNQITRTMKSRYRLECTSMIGQIGIGESGGVIHYSPDEALISRSHSVSGSQGLKKPLLIIDLVDEIGKPGNEIGM